MGGLKWINQVRRCRARISCLAETENLEMVWFMVKTELKLCWGTAALLGWRKQPL